MPNQILTLRDSMMTGVTAGFTQFMQFIPTLLGAIAVLFIGWTIARIVAQFMERMLDRVHFESAVSRAGISSYLQQAFGAGFTTTHFLGLMTKWFIRLIFVQATANILAMPQVTSIINSVILFIPNLFIALVILVVGGLAAQVAGRLVETSVARTGMTSAKLFSLIARYAVMGFAGIAAINQIGIATNLLNILFTGLVGSLALASGLAFGLGGQSVAQDLTRSWYEQGKSARSTELKAVRSPSQKS